MEFLTFAMEQVLENVGSFVVDEINLARGLKAELKQLEQSTQSIVAVLQDAEGKQEDPQVRRWLLKLRDVAYAAEDVLDKFSYETLRRRVEIDQHHFIRSNLHNFFSSHNPVLFRVKMAHQVKNINASLVDIENRALFKLALKSVAGKAVSETSKLDQDRETDSRMDFSIGRAEDIKTIIHMLDGSSSSSQQHLTVVAVVGMGGLGKTTLAKEVFNRAKDKNLFDKTVWICVSENFDFKKILKGMLQNLDQSTAGTIEDVEVILNRLETKLEGSNFLLVLDDVWNEKSEKWDSLKGRLEKICKKSGNVVLVTTRSEKVASTMGSDIYSLEGLPSDEIWSIIKHEVFDNDGDSLPPELETIGRAIAERCGGVPLAAKVVGGILRNKKVENWLSLKEDKVWDEVRKSKGIMPVLRLSFDRLPSALKQCFAYCSLFPKDFEFEKEILIEMWMAEGFLETSMNREGEEKAMEEVGDDYFHHLLAKSFFQDDERDKRGNVIGFKMHDLVHDLTLSVSALEMCVLYDGSDPLASSDFHRLSLLSENEQVLSIQGVSEFLRDGARKLRSFFSTFDVFPISPNFKSLRTLNLSCVNFKVLPASIGKWKHLRFIDISWNYYIEELPSSIRKLYNLQTLRLIECSELKEFPKEMRKLVSLRHIYFDEKRLIMPAGVGCLTNLQTLPLFIVGLEKGYKILELEGLKELKGKLKIQRLELVPNGEEAKRARLKDKTKLFELSLKWNCREDDSSSSSNNDEQVLEGLQPPPTVRRLEILNYMGKKIVSCQSWVPRELVELKLVDCKRCEVIPTLGHLAHLKVIEIEEMTNLKSIGIEFYGNKSSNSNSNGGPPFPALKEFTLNRMDNLVEWIGPEVVSGGDKTSTTPTPHVLAFPCLKVMEIYNCPCLPSIPITSNLITLETLTIKDCERCEEIPILGHLPCLKVLYIKGMRNVRRISIEFYGNKSISSSNGVPPFPALKEFILERMDSLLEWIAPESVSGGDKTSTTLTVAPAFPCLEVLKIYNCPCLPSIPIIRNLTSVRELSIRECTNLESLPSVEDLVSLKELDIDECQKLTSLPKGLHLCNSLAELSIWRCDELTHVGDGLIGSMSLRGLEIRECPRLTSLPMKLLLLLCTSLEKISILNCDELAYLNAGLNESDPLNEGVCGGPTSLKMLYITGCPKLTQVGDGDDFLHLCMSLKSLEISDCSNLTCITGIQHLTTLEILRVYGCPRLIFPDDILGYLTQLKDLTIGGFSSELEEFPGLKSINQLSGSLKGLSICGWDRLKTLPHQLQHLTSLVQLIIWDFNGVEALPEWLCNLSSLQLLRIYNGGILKSFPTATAMRRLSKLQYLNIVNCPLLKERCAKDNGPEWSKISHIQRIYLDGTRIN